ncbi:MAG: hypothetical protein U0X91_01895 [Spirosomataceae bacterium]
MTNAQTQGQLLEKANKKKSKELLKKFFDNWHSETPTITNLELLQLNDTVRQAYRAFAAFYKPLDVDSIGGSEWGNKIYENVDYLILQNKLWIYSQDKVFYTDNEIEQFVIDKINFTIKEDSTKQKLLKKENGKLSNFVIRRFEPNEDIFSDNDTKTKIDSILNFRPQISCNKKPLYLTKNYIEILNAFLGNSHYKLGTGGIMNPAKSKGQSEKRKKFLESYIKIWYGHWGGYWQLNSYPTCSSITFDKNFEYAKIQYRMVYEGGEAVLKNENGNWKLISSKRTWIE